MATIGETYDTAAATPIGSSRALTVRSARSGVGGDGAAPSGFVAQLIACAMRLPAYRRARRMDPAAAAVRYDGPAIRPRPALDRIV